MQVRSLSANEQWKLPTWLSEVLNDDWDKQIEDDANAGWLDKLLAEIYNEHKRGLTMTVEGGYRVYVREKLAARRKDTKK